MCLYVFNIYIYICIFIIIYIYIHIRRALAQGVSDHLPWAWNNKSKKYMIKCYNKSTKYMIFMWSQIIQALNLSCYFDETGATAASGGTDLIFWFFRKYNYDRQRQCKLSNFSKNKLNLWVFVVYAACWILVDRCSSSRRHVGFSSSRRHVGFSSTNRNVGFLSTKRQSEFGAPKPPHKRNICLSVHIFFEVCLGTFWDISLSLVLPIRHVRGTCCGVCSYLFKVCIS